MAVDVSPRMLATAQNRARGSGLENLEIVEAGLLTYEHRGEPADVVYCRNTLHHLPDFWKAVALQRTASFLRPGGILRLRDLVWSFEPADAPSAVTSWLDAAPDRPDAGWSRSELEAHLRNEHSTFGWLLDPMLERTGFEILESSYSEGVYARYVCARTGAE